MLGSLDLPSVLEPRGLCRTDDKRLDGVTMIPWEMGNQLVWDVTVVNALARSRLNQGSLCNPRTTATAAEARKNRESSGINRQRIHFSTGGLRSTEFFRREGWNFHHAFLLDALECTPLI